MRALLVLILGLTTHAAVAFPERLADTGLDEARALAFTPQYPLWSDGTAKRRWLALPPGASIDAARADAWQFPAGTRAWKEFSYGGRRIETRFIERTAAGAWSFAAYVWNAEGTEARLAPAEGATLPVADAPGGRYAVPSRTDCLACHEGAPVPILGFSALQLAAELPRFSTVLKNLPAEAPRVSAASPEVRAALGYLHANCGHCHNAAGPLANLGLVLAQPAGGESPADPARLLARIQNRNPLLRMPPLGVRQSHEEGAALVARWIAFQKESHP
jgi:mono/diheme cytochrome c family protein